MRALLVVLLALLSGTADAARVLLGSPNDSTQIGLGAAWGQFLPPALDSELQSPKGKPLGSLPPGRGGPVSLKLRKPPM